MRIGFIGAGNIGSALARLAVEREHVVVMSNSRGPQTLTDLVDDLGDSARAGTPAEAAAEGDVVVVTIPLKSYREVPVAELAGKTVIDTNNYYPQRDGQIAALDDGTSTVSELLQEHLPTSHVVKVFNSIRSGELASDGRPPGAADRRALPVAGDDAEAKKVVLELVEELGFDAVDAGPLAEGRRFDVGTPAYGPRLDAAALRAALDQA